MFELRQSVDWLKQAQYFNRLWHEREEYLRLYGDCLSDVERSFCEAEEKLLLHRKTECLLTAIRLTYDDAQQGREMQIQVNYDPNEKGVSGDGVFFSVSTLNHYFTGCHIPLYELRSGLTHQELAFFNISVGA